MEVTKESVKKQRILAVAATEATKWGVGTAVLVGLGTLAATYRSKRFDKSMSISAKVSLPVMASLGIWSYKYEVIMHEAKLFPERWGLNEEGLMVGNDVASSSLFKMPLHHRVMNYVYDHPFQWVSALGIPLTATILYQQRHNSHLTISQKVMHSRVFAQAGVIFILLSTMAFREYMDSHGRFPEPSIAISNTKKEDS